MNSQKDFWENEQVRLRRHPTHPVIEAFALPEVRREIAEIIQQHIGSENISGLSLLDAGCGNGYFTYYLDHVFNVTCLDFSKAILSVNPCPKKIQASAFEMPFRDNSFDVVFCANLLHHIENPLLVINEMARVSSRFIAIVEPNRYNPFMLLIALMSREDRLVIRYSPRYLRSLVTDTFRILWQDTSGFILPNTTPVCMLPFCKAVEPFLIPKIYNALVAEKK